MASQRHAARSLARRFRQDIQNVCEALSGSRTRAWSSGTTTGKAVFGLTREASVEYRPGHLVVDLNGTGPDTEEGGGVARGAPCGPGAAPDEVTAWGWASSCQLRAGAVREADRKAPIREP